MTRFWDIPVHDSTRVRDVRVAAEAAGGHARLGPHRTAVAALVATEPAANLFKHAGGGSIVIDVVERPGEGEPVPAVQHASLDHGPGIHDVTAATRDGHTTSDASLGAGLGTCRRTSSAFDLFGSHRGTVAVARTDPDPGISRVTAPPGPRAGGINVPLAHAEHSGDAWRLARSGPRPTLMPADGLGHGVGAAHASGTAADELRRSAHLPPADILRHMHPALRPTSGAAVAVAQLDTDRAELAFAGVGTIGAVPHTGTSWEPLILHPGIVGARFPATVPVRRLPWGPDNVLVLHSDGLPARWTPPDGPGLPTHDPAVVAATIPLDAGSSARPPRDDTAVAVLARARAGPVS